MGCEELTVWVHCISSASGHPHRSINAHGILIDTETQVLNYMGVFLKPMCVVFCTDHCLSDVSLQVTIQLQLTTFGIYRTKCKLPHRSADHALKLRSIWFSRSEVSLHHSEVHLRKEQSSEYIVSHTKSRL